MPQVVPDEIIEAPEPIAPPCSESQRTRVAAEILRALRHGTNREFLRRAALAPTVTGPLLETTLTWCAQSCEPAVARRARYVLTLIETRERGQSDLDDR